MITSTLSLDTRLANALVCRCDEEQWPVHITRGIPFQSENGNHLVDMTVEHEVDFQFGERLAETINRVFNLSDPLP